MSILRSFNIGVSGLGATGQAVSVIGDNIANAGTTGFKSSRPEFQDVLATTLGNTEGGDQFGGGTQLAHIKTLMTQGNITRTDNLTDLAIKGEGFFEVETPFGKAYTRDGSMHFDKDGILVNSDEYPIQGYVADEEGKITNRLGAMKVSRFVIPAKATTKSDLLLNLDSRAEILDFDINNIDKTSNFSHGLTVYDDNGTARFLTVVYNKLEQNNWQYRVLVDGSDAVGGEEGKFVEMSSGKLIFNNKGLLQEKVEEENTFNFKGATSQNIDFVFGQTIEEGVLDADATTQYGSEAQIARTTQDGYDAANLSSMVFDHKGTLVALYTNGISRNIGEVGIAKFDNNESLFKVGNNLYKESRKSGEATVGKSGLGGRGFILSRALELSNVDIAKEFVDLMTTQRNFSANAKSLTTADEMLQEVLSIKR